VRRGFSPNLCQSLAVMAIGRSVPDPGGRTFELDHFKLREHNENMPPPVLHILGLIERMESRK
jgi:hypothetical protein